MCNLPEGYRAVFKHERRYRTIRATRMSASDRTIMEPKGGVTHCKVLDAEGNIVAHTIARCRPNESYVKSLGRTIAGGRAQVQLVQLLEHEHAKELLA